MTKSINFTETEILFIEEALKVYKVEVDKTEVKKNSIITKSFVLDTIEGIGQKLTESKIKAKKPQYKISQ
jgi:hypothetical protein